MANIGLLLLIALIPFQIYFNLYQSLSLSVAQVFAGILFIYTFIRSRSKLAENWFGCPIDYSIFALLLVMFASIFVSGDRIQSVKCFVKWSSFILIYFVAKIS